MDALTAIANASIKRRQMEQEEIALSGTGSLSLGLVALVGWLVGS